MYGLICVFRHFDSLFIHLGTFLTPPPPPHSEKFPKWTLWIFFWPPSPSTCWEFTPSCTMFEFWRLSLDMHLQSDLRAIRHICNLINLISLQFLLLAILQKKKKKILPTWNVTYLKYCNMTYLQSFCWRVWLLSYETNLSKYMWKVDCWLESFCNLFSTF